MREGIELRLYNFFCEELARNGGVAQNAIDKLDYLVFIQNKDKFYALSEKEQTEIRLYIHTLMLIHKVNR